MMIPKEIENEIINLKREMNDLYKLLSMTNKALGEMAAREHNILELQQELSRAIRELRTISNN